MQKLQALLGPPPTRMICSLPVTTATAMDMAQRGTCILHCAQPSCWSRIHCSCRSTCGEFLLHPSCWHALWSIVYKRLAGEACVRSGCCERSRVRLAATVCRIGWWSQVSAVRFAFASASLILLASPCSDLQCWQGRHATLATAALLSLAFFVPLSVMICTCCWGGLPSRKRPTTPLTMATVCVGAAPMLMDASNKSDFVFVKLYMMTVNIAKCAMMIVAALVLYCTCSLALLFPCMFTRLATNNPCCTQGPHVVETALASSAATCLLLLCITVCWFRASPGVRGCSGILLAVCWRLTVRVPPACMRTAGQLAPPVRPSGTVQSHAHLGSSLSLTPSAPTPTAL